MTTRIEHNDPLVIELSEKLSLAPAIIQGCLGDLARQAESKESQGKMAKRWGVGFGQLSTMRNLGRVAIEEVRAGMVTQKLILANTLDGIVMDKLNDVIQVDKLSPRDAAVMAKQYTDSALNLANGQVGAPATQINIGDLKVLIDRRSQAAPYVSIKDKLAQNKAEKKAKVIEINDNQANTNDGTRAFTTPTSSTLQDNCGY